MENISSEEQLIQLRNEGKINEAEYNDLLETLRKSARADIEEAGSDESQLAKTSGVAIASLALALALGPLGCIPAIICGHLARRKIKKDPAVGGAGLALAGLIVGYTILVISIIAILMSSLLVSSRFEARRKEIKIRFSKIRRETHKQWAKVQFELKRFPVDTMEGIITQSGVEIDKQITSDGNGSLRIEATEPTTVRLFETGDIDIENAPLIYQAKVKTENIEGRVYLEMWCHFPGRGEFFSKDLVTPLSGTTEWTTEETPFFLKADENPDNIKLNLVIDGKGTAWIDDIRLLKGLLKY